MTASRSTLLRASRGTARVVAAGLVAAALLGSASAEAAPTPPVVASSGLTSPSRATDPTRSVQAAPTTTVRGTATVSAALRATPDAAGVVLGTLDAGQRIPTTSVPAKGWIQVRFRFGTAFVAATQLRLPGVGDEPPRPATISTADRKIATATLVVRSDPAKSGAVVGRITEGHALRLKGPLSHGYAQIRYAKKLRWVSVRYLAGQAPAQTALDFARAQLGKPYKFGAEGPKAYDCSGLTQSSWKAAGVSIPRTAALQSRSGTKINKADLQPGDLVFFYGKTPAHVAIYVGAGMVIHSPRPGKKVEYIKMKYMPYSKARRYR